MNSEITITKEALDDIIDLTSKSLVGKVLRRFEVLTDIKAIKASTKELMYEELRTLKSLLGKFSEGRLSVTKIITKGEV